MADMLIVNGSVPVFCESRIIIDTERIHGNNHDHPRGGDHDVHGRDVYDRYWSYPPLRGLASVSLLKVSARVGRLISNGVLALGFLAIEQPVERYEDKRDIPAVNVGLDEAEEEA